MLIWRFQFVFNVPYFCLYYIGRNIKLSNETKMQIFAVEGSNPKSYKSRVIKKSLGKDDVQSQREKKKKKEGGYVSKVYALYLTVHGSYYHKRYNRVSK